ncbi:hypothetical protein N7474_001851 [Penicillium riverlandense]|uniref:uncharacterized protein n=1 Tax=Penicillium riverlandense TaxID=1903569 RepID=UPI002548E89D|nr:uncharacterized protein N7474_001851 [Penicillium riverlandense]KAJ5833540.1 hypothetical protein N7474_001851 [Penicillium riverlandense]
MPSVSPVQTLRRRATPLRAATVEGWVQRRNSTLSDSISEARHSIRSSTDSLFLPRVSGDSEGHVSTEESHWHSAPLGLALLPAIAGVFFKEGSAFVTDVTLLVLAAIFLNWSVRLPWDWYRSAQGVRREEGAFESAADNPIESEVDEPDATDADNNVPQAQPSASAAATQELQIHELTALASCFIFPVIGTWLLHGIRSSLSRPSEGLVSNYNLTIFLLASEIRPVAHLLKLVQSRTLHLQRIVASSGANEIIDPAKVQDLSTRLDELEAHVAEAAAARMAASPGSKQEGALSPHEPANNGLALVAQAVSEARRSTQPEIEALNRAVRRYEKRTAITAHQTDTRLQHLEAQTRDALALAAAAQRSAAAHRPNYAFTLINWACACIVIPTQLALSVLSLPSRAASHCLLAAQRLLRRSPAPQPRSKSGKGKAAMGSIDSRVRPQSPPPPRAPAVVPLSRQQEHPLGSARSTPAKPI